MNARTRTEENALATIHDQYSELAPSAMAAEKQFEIQSAIIVARKFPRNEDVAFAKLMKACDRPSFADEASYSFKRGKRQDESGKWVDNYIEGPSVRIAREAARIWGNIRYGLDIIRDDEESRQIRGWAWDMETNTKVTAEDDFEKLIQRKDKDTKQTVWVKPDERDLRELTNRRGAILVRNCILQILPSDLIEDAISRSDETLTKKAAQDPEGSRKKIILAFSELNITPDMLEKYLGHPLAQCSPAQLATLRKVYRSIADGNSTWSEYVVKEESKAPKETGNLNVNEIKPGTVENRGHAETNLHEVGTTGQPTSALSKKDEELQKARMELKEALLDLNHPTGEATALALKEASLITENGKEDTWMGPEHIDNIKNLAWLQRTTKKVQGMKPQAATEALNI